MLAGMFIGGKAVCDHESETVYGDYLHSPADFRCILVDEMTNGEKAKDAKRNRVISKISSRPLYGRAYRIKLNNYIFRRALHYEKKVLALALAITTAMSLAGCGGSSAARHQLPLQQLLLRPLLQLPQTPGAETIKIICPLRCRRNRRCNRKKVCAGSRKNTSGI